MKEIILFLLNLPVATLLVTAGIVFLFIFTGGKVDRYGRVNTTCVDEQSSATVGVFLLASGLIASIIQLNIKSEFSYDHLLSTPPPCHLEESERPLPVNTSHRKGYHNLTLLREAYSNASSVTEKDPGKYQIRNINDGWYNSCRSWAPSSLPAWITIDLGKEFKVLAFAIGSDHSNTFTQGAITDFEMFISSEKDKDKWFPLFSYKEKKMPLTYTTHFTVKPSKGRFIKVVFDTQNPPSLQIDELEIYGRALKPWEMIRF